MTAKDAVEMARGYFEAKSADADRWLTTADFQLRQVQEDPGFKKHAAFSLHQAVETAYVWALLVHTLYFPRSHNIKFLRSLAEDVDKRLVEVWPRDARLDRRRFEMLKRAYVEARYSDQYDISVEDLAALMVSAKALADRVRLVCEERLLTLKNAI